MRNPVNLSYYRKLNQRHPVITFRCDDDELKEILESLPRGKRAGYIKNAIKTFAKKGSNTDIKYLKFLMDFFQQIGLTSRQRESITDEQRKIFREIVKVIENEQI
ncbi:hypothetical protein [Candidatus Harpocratesius sp.]